MAAKKFIGCLLLAICVQAILAADYDYSTSSGKGPNRWAQLFPNYCNGTKQTPVNIEVSKAQYANLGSLTMTGYETKADVDIKNNGHTFAVTVKPDTFSIKDGGLEGTYKLHSFHLHWGSDASKGSEHTVDDKMYPAELHLVHYNSKYANLSASLAHADGLAVLGIFFEVGDENAALQSFLKYTVNVTNRDSEIKGVSQTQTLKGLLPSNTDHFYRYSGGLTTPTCNEVVTWTVFNKTATMSKAQLDLLRNLQETNTTKLVDNYRPVEPLNGRIIQTTYKADSSTTAKPTGSGPNHLANHLAIIMALMAVTFKIVL
ncbi:carbonic anhydrase 2 isoform X2 [Exaiptasia diaphana]|nr:carbonic anhydrase 2 isoform X2 [Exaiptasia diaphana]ANJ59779.1 alpha carbonic anhydrase 3 [Exaiptasia diaphana]KXJ27896.1 Carbonic anhydrase 2 [Exaiptasia diaphana]